MQYDASQEETLNCIVDAMTASATAWERLGFTLQHAHSLNNRNIWDALERALMPIEARPRVVPNIEASHQTTRYGSPYVVIRNPAANTYLKLDPKEYEMLSLMDGTRTVKILVVEYYQKNGVLALPRISGLVQLLRSHQFLIAPPLNVYAALDARLKPFEATNFVARVVRGFLFSNLSVHNIDTQMEKMYRALGWIFFTRPAVLIGIVLSILGPLIYLEELARQRYPLFQIGGSYVTGILVILLLQSVTLIIHELGHAMAVKHAGRYVPRGGLLLYYGLPAGYVDTTDIWMSPRGKRLITSFAGPYTGLVLGGVCALGALLLPEGALGAFLFAWGLVLLVNALFNFNPLLELDGYYLLVDLLEKPSLRARALGFVRKTFWKKMRARETLTREEKFFALFGLASLAYSFFAIYLALRFWELRIGRVVGEALASGNLLAQGAVILLVALISIPLALALYSLARRLITSTFLRAGALGERAAARLHREALDALRAVPLWKDVPEPRLLQIARAMRAQDIAEGTEVVRQGEEGDKFYIVVRGAFEVLENGEAVNRLGSGNYFGELALLYHKPRVATVVAVEPSRVLWLDHDDFDALLFNDLQTRKKMEASLQYRSEIAAIPLLHDLTPAELDLLLSKLVPLSVAAGTEIIRQGELGDRFYIVRSGQIEIIQNGNVVATRGHGEAVGEIALLMNVPRTATVRAIEPTELLTLSRQDFNDVLLNYLNRGEQLTQLSQMRLETHKRLDELPRGVG